MDVPMPDGSNGGASAAVRAFSFAPPALVAHRPRAVECLALRPVAAGGRPVLALAASTHGGNVWAGEAALADLAPPAVGAGAAATAASKPAAVVELPQRDTVTAVAWAGAGGGSHLCVASDSGDVGVYAVGTDPFRPGERPPRAAAALEYHDDIVSSVVAVAGGGGGGALVATASWDGSVALWDVGAPRVPLAALAPLHPGGAVHALAAYGGGALAASSAGAVTASGGTDCRVHVADLARGGGGGGSNDAVLAGIRTAHAVTALAWLPALDTQLAVGTEDGGVAVYDVRALRLQAQSQGGGSVGGSDRRLHAPLARLPGHKGAVHALAAVAAPASTAPDGGGGGVLLASGGDDGAVRVTAYSGGTGAPLLPPVDVRAHGDYVRALAWAAAPQQQQPLALLSGGWDGAVLRHAVVATPGGIAEGSSM